MGCGLSSDEVEYLLSFLHDMGMLMWNDEATLREVVVLDPVSYLVVPATAVICKHKPDHGDPTHHISATHKECHKKYPDEWIELIDRGILHQCVLGILWREWSGQYATLLPLMIKFGLFVPLMKSRRINTSTVDASATTAKGGDVHLQAQDNDCQE